MRRTRRGYRETAALPSPPPVIEGITWAADVVPTAIDWLWPGLVPAGALALIEGRKGTGKSSVLASIAAAITGGPVPPGWVGPRDRRALWYCAEEDWASMILPRLLGAGCRADRVGHLALRDNSGRPRQPSLPKDCQAIGDLLWSAEIGLLVIDGYSSVLGAGLSTSQDQQVRHAWEPLVSALASARATCITSRHLRKGTAGDVTEHGAGSGAIMHIARVTLRCDRHPSERGRHTLSTVARSFGKPAPTQVYVLNPTAYETVRVDWLGASALDTESIAEGRGSEAERDEWQDADRLLASAIGEGWVSAGELLREAEGAGISPRMLRRAKARLGLPSRRVSFGQDGHWEWGAPPGGFPLSLVEAEQSGGIPLQPGAPSEAPTVKQRKKPLRRTKAPKAPQDMGDTPQGAPEEVKTHD